MTTKDEGWSKRKKNVRTDLDESLLAQFATTVGLPFEVGDNRTVAVKMVATRGIESLHAMKLNVRV